jgi:hypothetical protein|nr:MAG TPA: hypothetical protein [Caudoviricetes sp.]
MKIDEIMKSAALLGACSGSGKVSDWKSLVWLFFSPQGREFCEEKNFPELPMFREMKRHGISELGVFVDEGNVCRSNDKDIALVGDTCGELKFDENNVVHKIILMHGAKARIKASNYAVLLIVNIGGCEVEIDKDKTVVVL